MKHPLFESLGDRYPFHLEERFDRILVKIELLWDYPEIDDYFSELMIDKRGSRQGFSKAVMDDILQLRDFRESVTIRDAEHKADAIGELERRGVSVNKDQFFKSTIRWR